MKNILLFFVGAIVFIALVFLKLDFTGFVHIVSERLSWTFYTIICFLITIQLLLRSVRFKLLFGSVFKDRLSLPESFLITSASFFVALATPNKVGDMARGFFAKGRALETTAISIIEYLLDALIALTIPAIGLFFLHRYYLKEIAVLYALLILGLVVSFVLLRYCRLVDMLNRFDWYRKNMEKIGLMKLYFMEGLKNRSVISMGLLCTCLFYGLIFSVCYAVLHRLGAQTTFPETVIAMGLGIFLGSLTFIPMGLGTRDASIYGVLTTLGTDPDLALSSVIVIRSLSLPLVLVSGLCYFLSIRRINI
jgi:uncharacterized protein (TIRG00374 family)